MSTERDVVEVFERANPVPDPELVEVEPDAARFLADLLDEQSAEVRIGPSGSGTAPARRRWIVPTIAAAIAAVGIAGISVIVHSDTASEMPADAVPVTVPDADDSVTVTTRSATTPGSTPTTVPTTQAATVTAPTGAVPRRQSPDDIPLVESGTTYASPVGDITWTRIDGDASSVPQSVDFDSGGRFYGVDDDGTSWVSDDGIAWSETDPLPGQSGDYANVGDDVWTLIQPARSGEPARLGRWNGVSFEPVDLTEIEPPDVPQGLRVIEEFADLDSLGDKLVVTVGTRFGLDPANEVMEFGDDVDKETVAIQWIDDDSYQVIMMSAGTANNLGPDFTMLADAADPDVALITTSDGNVVGRVGPWPGLDAEQLIEQLRADGVVQRETFIGGDNGLETLQDPPSGLRGVAKVGDVALALSRDASKFSLWRTDDLSTWERVDIPMDAPGTLRSVTLASNGTEAILDLHIDPPMHGEVWITDDGTTWRTTNVPLVWSSVVFTDFGSVRSSRGDGTGLPLEIRPGASDAVSWQGDSVWVSRDGIDWQGFGLEFVPSPNGGWTRTNVLANKIFVGQQAGTDRTIWVGDVQTG